MSEKLKELEERLKKFEVEVLEIKEYEDLGLVYKSCDNYAKCKCNKFQYNFYSKNYICTDSKDLSIDEFIEYIKFHTDEPWTRPFVR